MTVKITPRVFYLACAALVFAADQAAKQWAVAELSARGTVVAAPFLNWTLVYNPGAAFGLLSDAGGWQTVLFATVAAAVSALVVFLLWKMQPGQPARAAGLCLILGGAMGNLSDRVFIGAVVDFVDLHYRGFHWPAFNIADAAISCGVFLLVFTMLHERVK
ncbi:MAG: signal peptidase II [Gammaproteobacteria bacterium]|nr:signal peptidase II [Gammaproteobacteria bacterium]MDD9870326.1 signal peptidase II [Gammaproteobacteria bacterium]